MSSPVVAAMKEFGAPMTREEYLRWNFLGKPPSKITPEMEEMIPEQFQIPVVGHTAMPQPKGEEKNAQNR